MITTSEPRYVVVLLRDLDIQFTSGNVISTTLEPEDAFYEDPSNGNITVTRAVDGQIQVFYGRNMEAMRLLERPHRRKAEEKEARPPSESP